jgi:RNA polymerase sigma-70 factor (ECF subfamily)
MGGPATGVRELFDAEYPSLVRLATLIIGDLATAEEVVQEAFARALARWRRLREYDRPGAWVRRVTIRLAVRARERRMREIAHARVPDVASADPGPPDPELMDALQSLPATQRAAVVLFYFDDRSVEEVADLLGVPSSTARSHLHRARNALARTLSPTEVVTDVE